jgi:hypothetical protein
MYEYSDSHTIEVEAIYAEVGTVPVCDCESPYDGSSNAGASHVGTRIRTAAVFIEGGMLHAWGHEDLWPFGKTGLFSEGLSYTQVLTHSSTVEAGRIFAAIKPYVSDLNYAPTSAFVTTGEGTTTAKAAQGASPTAALAYFPSSRTVSVDTTILSGTGNVRLRWFDPTTNSYTVIAASEAQQTGRSITYPSAHADSNNDWLLIVDLV